MESKKIKKYIAQMVLFSILTMPVIAQAAGNSIVANDTLPTLDNVVAGIGYGDISSMGTIMDVRQNDVNAIIKWKDFSIGANASVNFSKKDGGTFNTLNYVTGGDMSQIYGKMNAAGGNIYLVNPNGVQIGNSAQINVGSLHVANKKIDNIDSWNNGDFQDKLASNATMTNAELMSLGHITATNLTFEGSRVVLDMDRIKGAKQLNIVGSADIVKDNDIVLGTDDVNSSSWAGKVTVNGETQSAENLKKNFTYQWIKDGKELGLIGTDEKNWSLSGNYALRYAIDLTGSNQRPISESSGKAFKGKFDGLNNNIFGLTIDNSSADRKNNATGLFGYTDGAMIGNLKLIAGNEGVSIKGGDNYTGALIGHAKDTKVNNVTNTLQITGNANVGGLIGHAENSTLTNLINTGTVQGKENVGGIVGSMQGGSLGVGESNTGDDEQTHNLGRIKGLDDASFNIGGLVGYANDAVIGAVQNDGKGYAADNLRNSKDALYNAGTISGGYNVGGIVGNMTNTTVKNARNESKIIATGYTEEDYYFRTDYTKDGYANASNGMHKESVRMANAGGIAGNASGDSKLTDVTNSGNVESAEVTGNAGKETNVEHYGAGNVGGIVGRAENTNISNVTNFESDIRGAMNVGGIAGYFGSKDAADKQYRISNAVNDGGNVLASGGISVDGNSFSREITRKDYKTEGTQNNGENYITGNIGGIAGLLFGESVYVDNAVNRGTVHTEGKDIYDRDDALLPITAEAANVGGIVGKIDRGKIGTDIERLNAIKKDIANAVISSSHNTGVVQGYTNIGGIAGFAYNGSIASSYNIGKVNTTRSDVDGTKPVNIGGILGDSTENASGRVVLYDVYNKGEIGDKNFEYLGRHVGGIVGRLSGIVEKAYNTGDIYNGSNVAGGIAGYWYSGQMKNVFNTGNITVWNKNENGNDKDSSQVGGIVGAIDVSGGNISDGEDKNLFIKNAYNLGTIRSYRGITDKSKNKANSVGGIVGSVVRWNNITNKKLDVDSVYSTGNLYADKVQKDGGDAVGKVIGERRGDNLVNSVTNAFYIRPTADSGFRDLSVKDTDTGLDPDDKYNVTTIDFKNKVNKDSYNDNEKNNKLDFVDQANGKLDFTGKNAEDTWRIYDDGLPILNAFLPDAEKYFGDKWNDLKNNGLDNVQYGTAYNPLLTIVKAKKDQAYDWKALGIKDDGSLAVLGAGLTLNNISPNHNNLFGGTIYTDGALTINANDNISLGSEGLLSGASVTINANGNLLIMGKVQATGNKIDSKTYNENESNNLGNVTINAGSLDVYGEVSTAKQGEQTTFTGLRDKADYNHAYDKKEDVTDKTKLMTTAGEKYKYETSASERDGNLTITTTTGDTNIRYGNMEKGKLNVAGNMDITSAGNIFIDADIYSVNAKIGLNAAGGEAVLDLTNIGATTNTSDKKHNVDAIHDFVGNHGTEDKGIIGSDETKVKIALDVWDAKQGVLDYKQYDKCTGDGAEQKVEKLSEKLQKLYVKSNGYEYQGSIKDVVYTWISSAEQLAGIQNYAEKGEYKDSVLSYNFMLKNDIDASELTDYKSIASGDNQVFTGTFDGRNQRIIGLHAKNGLFTNNAGTIENIKLYSSVFTGADGSTIGAIAANNIMQSKIDGEANIINRGLVQNITGLGNTIIGDNGATIGGLVGKNTSVIRNVGDESTVIAGINTTAGGIVGANTIGKLTTLFFGEQFDMTMGGNIFDAQSNSAITTKLAAGQYATNLGGIAGLNVSDGFGEIDNVSVRGVTGKAGSTTVVGGIVGTNNGIIRNAYNESLVHGKDNLGGVAGINAVEKEFVLSDGSTVETRASINYVTNASEIIGDADSENVGGLVGAQKNGASLELGRNTGVVEGTTNVGGFAGYNDANTILNNLENAPQASITGVTNVGGIAGYNKGSIFGSLDLVNEGKITGVENVGGVVGVNEGDIEGINANVTLYVKDNRNDAKYFGGIAGKNIGVIKDAKNKSIINADEAEYVGGIVGWNTEKGTLTGLGNESSGVVIGKNYVGGVIGRNEGKISHWSEEKTEYKGQWRDYNGNPLPDDTDVEDKYFDYEFDGNGDVIVKNKYTIYHKTKIENNGTVIAKAGGAGGLIGDNQGEIEDSTWINNGKVHGATDGGTGGIFGVNNGYVHHSDLINNIDAQVTGAKNVGGLIGINHGRIAGGRGTLQAEVKQYVIKDGEQQDNPNTDAIYITDANYYATKIYNNGTIVAGTRADDGTIKNVAGENIGGLIGVNEADGVIGAAYNTGAINADGSKNVGGIVGSNAGKIDQVFNTVAVRNSNTDGSYSWNTGSVTGRANVGGIVGNNSGTLTNAYNTTDVSGTTNVGSIAGNNSGTVSDTYDSNAKNGQEIVGSGNAAQDSYIFQAGSDAAKKEANYGGLDFAGGTWKIYEGYSGPLLKMFLTNVAYDPTKDTQQHGTNKDVNQLINDGALKDLSGKNFDAYDNAYIPLINYNGSTQTDGSWLGILWSKQLGYDGKNGNPNNLGYDLSPDGSQPPLPPEPDPPVPTPPNFEPTDNYWYKTAPWDKERHFRERKAEFNYVAGGVHIADEDK